MFISKYYKGMGLKGQQSGLDNQHLEFNIQQEDFPALPRPQSVHNKSNLQISIKMCVHTIVSTSYS